MAENLNRPLSLASRSRRLLWALVVAALLVTTLSAVGTPEASAAPPECVEGVQVGLYCAIEADVDPVETVGCPASSTIFFADGQCFTRIAAGDDGVCLTGTTPDPRPFTCRWTVDLSTGTYCLPQGEGLYQQNGACFRDTLVPGVVLECPQGELSREICRIDGGAARPIDRECPLGKNVFSTDGSCFALVERVGGACPSFSTDHPDSDRCQRQVDLRPVGTRCEIGFARSNSECRRFVDPAGLPELDCSGVDVGALACINHHQISQAGSPELAVGVPTEVVLFKCSGVNPGVSIEDHLGRVFPVFGMAEREPGVYVATFQVDQPGSYGFSILGAPCPNGQQQGSVNFGATFAGEGTELVLCDNERITITALPGVTTTGTQGNDVILGTAGDDVINGLGGNDTICSLDGDDVVDAGPGHDTVLGGNGDDVVAGGDGDDDIDGEDGRDVLRGGPGDDLVVGGPGDDRIVGGIGDDRLGGDGGDDYLGGFGGDDTIVGGAGKDIIFGGFGADVIMGEAGDDRIFGLIGDDLIMGGTGSDTIAGNRGNDEIFGGAGGDTIRGGNANDVIDGRQGNDNISGGKADDVLVGGEGEDVCSGNLENTADTADATCETIFGIP